MSNVSCLTPAEKCNMSKLLPDWFIGVLLGFAVAVLAWTGLAALLGIDAEAHRFLWFAFVLTGTVCGGVLGMFRQRPAGEGGTAARWSIGMGVVVGALSFLPGFAGAILLRPDSPQGPLLGIFITGPLGTVAGLVVGLLIGLILQGIRTQRREARS
jgi:hypothetical protein